MEVGGVCLLEVVRMQWNWCVLELVRIERFVTLALPVCAVISPHSEGGF